MKNLLSSIAVAVAVLGAVGEARAVAVTLSPSLATTTIGGTVSLDIVVSGLTAANEIVSGYQYRILFDDSVLSGMSVSQAVSPFGGVGNVFGGWTIAPGQILLDLVEFGLTDDDMLVSLQGDAFVIATLNFTGRTDGSTVVDFGPDAAFDRNTTGRTPNGGTTQSLAASYSGACVIVGSGSDCQAVVPEPASYGLAAIALLAAGWASRRRRPFSGATGRPAVRG